MRPLILGVVAGMLVTVFSTWSENKLPLPKIDSEIEKDLLAWLHDHGKSPENYVLSKFADHDIIFLGEYHRIRHDAVLVQDLIPLLYLEGIRNLGIEFARARDQDAIDRLLTMDSFDEKLANTIFWNQWPFWGYKEYIDILRVAWEVNKNLSEEELPFRVIGLNARMDWSHVWSEEDRGNREVMKKVLPDGDSDEVMAETIRREILAKGEKALIYSGINHAYTKFQQPIVDEESGELVRLVSNRMGNRIYSEIGECCFTIFLHSPWPAVTGYSDPGVYPADGIIDALFSKMADEERRVGFDIVDSPFGRLRDTNSYWSHSAEDFRLDMYCDGWICQKPLSDYVGVTAVEGWFNESNRLDAIAQIANPDPRVKNKDVSVDDLMESLISDTDFKRRFKRFR
ncbi:MAG: hypothetical protein GTO42_01215 [Candidatus Latescibacteria bacterium]|nr:hypothetical protein [Candidatus Latescibacterota bacterium]NIO27149.1 hypothetical protein [Candidatus Latescibacterota bacterium]NIO54673.1 hypothetical protein [Candidatus Latescibacterota bacterium]NIT00756.1 hypothetical protein [Candidatus Latescibacterota bacterium]NIT37679.1 hypothetical protein [Candidatus Latescibacterota bacterium]